MSKTSDYRSDTSEQMNIRAGADLRLRVLTLKDLAHAFLEELGTVGVNDSGAGPSEGPIDFYDEVRRFEIEMIESALRRTNGVQTEAAALLGLKPSTLHAKLKLYQLSAADYARPMAVNEQDDREDDAQRSGYAEESREMEERSVPVLA